MMMMRWSALTQAPPSGGSTLTLPPSCSEPFSDSLLQLLTSRGKDDGEMLNYRLTCQVWEAALGLLISIPGLPFFYLSLLEPQFNTFCLNFNSTLFQVDTWSRAFNFGWFIETLVNHSSPCFINIPIRCFVTSSSENWVISIWNWTLWDFVNIICGIHQSLRKPESLVAC